MQDRFESDRVSTSESYNSGNMNMSTPDLKSSDDAVERIAKLEYQLKMAAELGLELVEQNEELKAKCEKLAEIVAALNEELDDKTHEFHEKIHSMKMAQAEEILELEATINDLQKTVDSRVEIPDNKINNAFHEVKKEFAKRRASTVQKPDLSEEDLSNMASERPRRFSKQVIQEALIEFQPHPQSPQTPQTHPQTNNVRKFADFNVEELEMRMSQMSSSKNSSPAPARPQPPRNRPLNVRLHPIEKPTTGRITENMSYADLEVYKKTLDTFSNDELKDTCANYFVQMNKLADSESNLSRNFSKLQLEQGRINNNNNNYYIKSKSNVNNSANFFNKLSFYFNRLPNVNKSKSNITKYQPIP